VPELFVSRFPDQARVGVLEASDILWTLTASEIADRLVRQRGWTSQAFESWLATAMADALVAPRRVSSR
jgi:hypothetical protein